MATVTAMALDLDGDTRGTTAMAGHITGTMATRVIIHLITIMAIIHTIVIMIIPRIPSDTLKAMEPGTVTELPAPGTVPGPIQEPAGLPVVWEETHLQVSGTVQGLLPELRLRLPGRLQTQEPIRMLKG